MVHLKNFLDNEQGPAGRRSKFCSSGGLHIMDETESNHSGTSSHARGLRSNAIQRKINELIEKDKATIQATEEAINSNHLAPPRKLSNQLSGSLPNIAFSSFQNDLFLHPYLDQRSSPSPMRHERSSSPRVVPFPCSPARQHSGCHTPEISGSPQRQGGLFLPVPAGFPPLQNPRMVSDCSLSSGCPSPLGNSTADLRAPFSGVVEHVPLSRKRSSSFSPLFSSEDAQTQIGQNGAYSKNIPVPNIPNMPWCKPPGLATHSTSQHNLPFIPVPNVPFIPHRKCGCGGIQLGTGHLPHNVSIAPYANTNGFRTTNSLDYSVGSPQTNGEFLSLLIPSSNGISRSSSTASFDASLGGSESYGTNSPNIGFDGRGFTLNLDPSYQHPYRLSSSPSSSMANLNLNHYTQPVQMHPVQSEGQFIPVPQGFHPLPRYAVSEPQIAANSYIFDEDRATSIPSVVVTEPFENTVDLSPSDDVLDKMLMELLCENQPDLFSSMNDGTSQDLDLSPEQLFDEDLTILNEIATSELKEASFTMS